MRTGLQAFIDRYYEINRDERFNYLVDLGWKTRRKAEFHILTDILTKRKMKRFIGAYLKQTEDRFDAFYQKFLIENNIQTPKQTRRELLARAAVLGVRGRSSMNKEQLITAINGPASVKMLSKRGLYQRTKELGVRDRSKMNKEQLSAAINKALGIWIPSMCIRQTPVEVISKRLS